MMVGDIHRYIPVLMTGSLLIIVMSGVGFEILTDSKRRYEKRGDRSYGWWRGIQTQVLAGMDNENLDGKISESLKQCGCADISQQGESITGWTEGLWFTRGGSTPCQIIVEKRYSNETDDILLNITVRTRYFQVDSRKCMPKLVDRFLYSFNAN